jgi:hypothetical protein
VLRTLTYLLATSQISRVTTTTRAECAMRLLPCPVTRPGFVCRFHFPARGHHAPLIHTRIAASAQRADTSISYVGQPGSDGLCRCVVDLVKPIDRGPSVHLQCNDDPACVLRSAGWARSTPGSSFLWWGNYFLARTMASFERFWLMLARSTVVGSNSWTELRPNHSSRLPCSGWPGSVRISNSS